MDQIAKIGYKKAKGALGKKDDEINSVDALVISGRDEWFLLEFKDVNISGKKDSIKNSILKKAYSTLYMILDILYYMNLCGKNYPGFTYDQPITFVKQHINFILICSHDKNPVTYDKVKACDLKGEKYTPPFMQRLKDYLFKDAYVYTEYYLEHRFVNTFEF